MKKIKKGKKVSKDLFKAIFYLPESSIKLVRNLNKPRRRYDYKTKTWVRV